METDIVIIGGGAAGMMAAVGAGKCGAKALVLEKMPRPGRKIMISGKGRCNFTNMKDWQDFSAHVHPKAAFLKNAFYNFSPEDTVAFFRENGMESVVERGDRVFPASYKACDVVDTLVKAMKKAGAELVAGAAVTGIRRDQEKFVVSATGMEDISAGKLILATGGLSYPGTGSTGDGYVWAENFGHRTTRRFPSLTALVPSGYKSLPDGMPEKGHIDRALPLSDLGRLLAGNSLRNITLTALIDGNPAAEEFGDLDFTDGGIEGPCGFRVSRKCVNAIDNGSKVSFRIDLKPAVAESDLENRIGRLWKEIGNDRRSAGKSHRDRFSILLGKLVPMSLAEGFLRSSSGTDVGNLAHRLKNWEFRIPGYVGYERCVVTAGGVATDGISPRTMESRTIPGLFMAGEILDLDCDTGGYNLQTAFSTGMLAGMSAAK